ncbi:tRNA (N(6)-L-threonylcarbamoyladenosine(37)-C(2))-methylthiotransferase MtaB [Candidatus Uabimicrobium sp. HlEnr_7]|uniref:tRNA (N(6)-L-threonylcarbamoyladenosine(37)-C(2))- methylthiotransferase MtaB n=1 Tax=Candidatus Uabimicrobium helgolandensis TaxID=3095367 RepID=UPI003555DB45
MLKASFYTLGCRLNQAETALISSTFTDNGYEIVPFSKSADVCVINSCTVTEHADSKCRQLVRQVLKRNPETYVAVVGCYSQTSSEELKKVEGIDLIIGTQEKLKVLQHIDEPSKTPVPKIVRDTVDRKSFTIDIKNPKIKTTRANIKIQDGCDFMCSFCVIPFARGRARSRAFWDIQREAIDLASQGFKELVVTGVNIGTYQFEDKSFLDVIKMLLTIPGLERIRISSIEPTTIPLELLDIMADNEKLCSHLHIPLQSGCDKTLQAMRRKYTIKEYMDFIDLAYKKMPNVMLATDIIVGFPGETDEDFAQTCATFNNSPLTYVHVFSFSQRDKTAANRLPEKVTTEVKKQRSKKLHILSNDKKLKFYEQSLGQTVRLLLENKDHSGRWQGFSDNYIKIAVDIPGASKNDLINVQLKEVVNDVVYATQGEF